MHKIYSTLKDINISSISFVGEPDSTLFYSMKLNDCVYMDDGDMMLFSLSETYLKIGYSFSHGISYCEISFNDKNA